MSETPAEVSDQGPAPFRVAFVPGVTPGKWLRIWKERLPGSPIEVQQVDERDQVAALRDGPADMVFVRLPVDRHGLNLIPLYREVPVVVVPRDHPVAAYDEISVVDLAHEHLLQDPDTVPEWREAVVQAGLGTPPPGPTTTIKQAIETVGAGTGIVIVPKSVARLYNRKDVTHRPVVDVAESQVGLAWAAGATDPRIETFIGIVRGRTERSSRGGDIGASSQESARKTVPKAVKPGSQQQRPSSLRGARRGGGRGRRRGGR